MSSHSFKFLPKGFSIKTLQLFSKDFLIINIEDRGNGFDQKILSKIGQPNLSTKGSSGIGIFLALNILESFNANLKIENLKKGGAKITVNIPLC
jgi:two-component system sensor histidine kinase RegB